MIAIKQLQPAATTGTVITRSGNVYRVRTGSGRIVVAESAEVWAVGATVTILSGQIVGRAGSMPTTKIYEV